MPDVLHILTWTLSDCAMPRLLAMMEKAYLGKN